MGELTSAKTVPYLIVLSTILSIRPSIIGEYVSNIPSSSLRDERRVFVYGRVVSSGKWETEQGPTVGFGEKSNSNEQWYFPTSTFSAFLRQIIISGLVGEHD